MELKVVQKKHCHNHTITISNPHDHYYNHHHHTITSSHHYDENISIPYCQLPPSEPSTIDILVGGQNVNEVFASVTLFIIFIIIHPHHYQRHLLCTDGHVNQGES